MKMANEVVVVGPEHRLWTTFDDDDWNGATCSMWIRSLSEMHVTLQPPVDLDPDLLSRIRKSLEAYATTVVVGKTE